MLFFTYIKIKTMKTYIKIVITTKGCDNEDALIGFFGNGRLHISFSSIPELIYIITDEAFSASEGELCLEQLREKLNNCNGVTMYASAIIYHGTSSHKYLFGVAQNKYDELKVTFVERDYFIEYSLCNLAIDI
jgi:hypothetical protein